MDASRFTDARTGQLVKIELPQGKDWAFIPDPLPSEWEIPSDVLHELLGDAREQLGTLGGIGQTLLNPTLLLRPLQQREAIRSSSLEGTDVHAMELLKYQLDPTEPLSARDKRNAWREVTNHDYALHRGTAMLQDIPLCSRLIRELHKTLLSNVRGLNKRPGKFRDRQVHIGSDRRFVPAPVSYIENLMGDLETFLNDAKSNTNPLVRAYMAHYQFEAIHPFLDGNGRIGRVLLSLCTYLWHGHVHPWLYMSAYFDRYKDEYVDNLFRVSTHGDWTRWIEFCLRGTVTQCQDAIKRCQQLASLRDYYHIQADGLSPRMRRIIDSLFESTPVFKTKDVMGWCVSSRPTAQKDVEKLLTLGIVERLEEVHPRTYFVPNIMGIAYSDDTLEGPKSGD